MRHWTWICILLIALTACGEDVIQIPGTPQAGLPERPTATAENASEPTEEPEATEEPAEPPTPTEEPSDGPAIPPLERPLQVGDEGDDVLLAQTRLIELGYTEVGEADGIFGENTRKGVRNFQLVNGLGDDGIIGEDTWNMLFSPEASGIDTSDMFGPSHIGYISADGTSLRRVSLSTFEDTELAPLNLDPAATVWQVQTDPTGRYFGIAWGNDNNSEVWIYRTDGTLLSTLGGYTDLEWSSDGEYFAAYQGDLVQPKIYVWRSEREDEEGPVVEIPGMRAGWVPGTHRLAIAQDTQIITYDLDGGIEEQIAEIDPQWYIYSVLPTEEAIFFYTGRLENLGATGNGMQWMAVPLAPGTAGCSQQAFGCGDILEMTAPNGNLVEHAVYDPISGIISYSENVHSSACSSYEDAYIRLNQTETGAQAAPIPSNNAEGYAMQGVTMPPGSSVLVYGFQAYGCTDTGRDFGPPEIFMWNYSIPGDEGFSKLADGTFPFWLP